MLELHNIILITVSVLMHCKLLPPVGNNGLLCM